MTSAQQAVDHMMACLSSEPNGKDKKWERDQANHHKSQTLKKLRLLPNGATEVSQLNECKELHKKSIMTNIKANVDGQVKGATNDDKIARESIVSGMMIDEALDVWIMKMNSKIEDKYPSTMPPIGVIEPTVAMTIRKHLDDIDGQDYNENLLLFPVSDADDDGGGSHWSLLLVHVPSSKMFHYDSSATKINKRYADTMVENLITLLELDSTKVRLQNVNPPVQTDSESCGPIICQIM